MAWQNLTDRTTSDPILPDDPNTLMENIRVLGGNGTDAPSSDIETLASDRLKRDGTTELTSDWDIGDGRKIEADEIRARDADGLKLYDDGGNGLEVKDGGQVYIDSNAINDLEVYGRINVGKPYISSTGYAEMSFKNIFSGNIGNAFIVGLRNDVGGNNGDFKIVRLNTSDVIQDVPFQVQQSSGNIGLKVSSPSYQLELSTDSAGKPSTNTWTVTSDKRLKENIEDADLDICYNTVKNLKLKRYKWKDDVYTEEEVPDRNMLGWIAQDVEAHYPKAVETHKKVITPEEKDEEGNVIQEEVSIDDCKSLQSDQIIKALYGTVQKLQEKVERLEKIRSK